jgi:hypothetical protein
MSVNNEHRMTDHPATSAVTITRGREPLVVYTWKVPSLADEQDLQQALSPQIRGHFSIQNSLCRRPIVKGHG